jgi:hypothetical protein
MSRATRRSTNLGPRKVTGLTKPNQKKLLEVLFRRQRRELIQKGLIPDPRDRPPRWRFDWTYGDLTDSVYAETRSEARALIKTDLGIRKNKRLPIEVVIERYPNIEEDSDGNSAEGLGEDHDGLDRRAEAG